MHAHHTRLSIFCLVALLALTLFCGSRIVSSLAQNSSQENPDALGWKVKKVGAKRNDKKVNEADSDVSKGKVIEDQIPLHLPIKVELLNLQKEPLLNNLEIRVTNTSSKPIYYLDLSLLLPDVLSPNGNPITFPLQYGRKELLSFQEPIQPEDASIPPGESFIFKIPEMNLEGFARFAAKKKLLQSEIKKIYLLFHLLNFGDKTGFSGTGGYPIRSIPKGQASNDSCAGGAGEARVIIEGLQRV